jgi:hypothetical protein
MRWRRRRQTPGVIASEKGLFELVGRQTGLDADEAFVKFRDLVSAHIDWAESRKRRNRRYASWLRYGALFLTAAATVVVGIATIPRWVALPMVALVTVLSGLEVFRNWRPLWVLMEEAQYRFNRLRDEMDFHLVTTPAGELTFEKLAGYFGEHQAIWDDVSRQWLGFRKLDQDQDQPTAPG